MKSQYAKRSGLWVPESAICRMNPAFLGSWAKPVSGGGGGGGFTLLNHAYVNGTGTGTATSSGIDTTGVNLLVAWVHGGTFTTFSDSKGNTWTNLNDPSSTPRACFYYCLSPTVGTGHTFSNTNGNSALIAAFAKSGTPAFDAQAAGSGGNYYSGQSQSPGSITPATAADVMVTGIVFDTQASTTGASINSSYSILDAQHSTNGVNIILAYKIKSDATAENPTWAATWAFGPGADTGHSAFK
jgi:hypothetical protein